jgi:hypothetical protein
MGVFISRCVCVCAPPRCCPHAFYPHRERLNSLRRPPRVLPLGAPHQAPPRAARVPPRAFYYTPRAVLMRAAWSIGCACVCRLYAVMSHLNICIYWRARLGGRSFLGRRYFNYRYRYILPSRARQPLARINERHWLCEMHFSRWPSPVPACA